MMTELNRTVTWEIEDQVAFLRFHGSLLNEQADEIREALDSAKTLDVALYTLDLREVGNMSSSTFGEICAFIEFCRSHTWGVTIYANANVSRLCRIVGIDKLVTIHENED